MRERHVCASRTLRCEFVFSLKRALFNQSASQRSCNDLLRCLLFTWSGLLLLSDPPMQVGTCAPTHSQGLHVVKPCCGRDDKPFLPAWQGSPTRAIAQWRVLWVGKEEEDWAPHHKGARARHCEPQHVVASMSGKLQPFAVRLLHEFALLQTRCEM